jgi:hypothetical protein
MASNHEHRLHALGVALLFCTSFGDHFYLCRELERFEHQAKGDGSLTLLVAGDWVRRGF